MYIPQPVGIGSTKRLTTRKCPMFTTSTVLCNLVPPTILDRARGYDNSTPPRHSPKARLSPPPPPPFAAASLLFCLIRAVESLLIVNTTSVREPQSNGHKEDTYLRNRERRTEVSMKSIFLRALLLSYTDLVLRPLRFAQTAKLLFVSMLSERIYMRGSKDGLAWLSAPRIPYGLPPTKPLMFTRGSSLVSCCMK